MSKPKLILYGMVIVFILGFAVLLTRNRVQVIEGPHFQVVKCWFNGSFRYRTTCGYYRPTGIKSSSKNPIVLPVVYISDRFRKFFNSYSAPTLFIPGGPGYPVGIDNKNIKHWFEWMKKSEWPTDLLLFEPRGVGLSKPRLRCDTDKKQKLETEPAFNNSSSEYAYWKKYYRKCARDLIKRGIDLNEYNTINNYRDAIGIMNSFYGEKKKWNIISESYGTKLAQLLLEYNSEKVLAVVMDSLAPNDKDTLTDVPFIYNNLINNILDKCSLNKKCHAELPDLRHDFIRLLTHLNTSPKVIEIEVDGEPSEWLLNKKTVLELLLSTYYQKELIGVIPMAIHRAFRGEYGYLKLLIKYKIAREKNISINESTPVLMSVVCSGRKNTSAKEYFNIADQYPLVRDVVYSAYEYDFCKSWPVRKIPGLSSPNKKIQNNLNTKILLFSGFHDVITPERWAKEYVHTYPKSYLFRFISESHGIIDHNRCAMKLARQFVLHPEKKPISRCIKTQHDIEYFN